MAEPRIQWEPINLATLPAIQNSVTPLVAGRGGVTIMKNGTLLFLKKAGDDIQSARLALEEAKYLVDFRVKRLLDGNFLVALHSAVAVFVGKDEFVERRAEIEAKIGDLKFPGEELLVPPGWSDEEFLVGLYGRGKMQRDVHEPNFQMRIE